MAGATGSDLAALVASERRLAARLEEAAAEAGRLVAAAEREAAATDVVLEAEIARALAGLAAEAERERERRLAAVAAEGRREVERYAAVTPERIDALADVVLAALLSATESTAAPAAEGAG
jgi:colicin import membrane protein/SWI/SNF-related matrix-associated actin-dependent regulator 1 of chromatin subfamily A